MPDTKTIAVFVFVAGFAVGASFSSWINKIYIKKVEQELTEYKQNQKQILIDALSTAQTQQKESADAYRIQQEKLQQETDRNAVLQRAIAAGRLRLATCARGDLVQPAERVNETRSDPVPVTGNVTEESVNQVVNDCAATTLMLNNLQADIEKQLAQGTK